MARTPCTLSCYETSAPKIMPHGSFQCQYGGCSGPDHFRQFRVPSKHSGKIITDPAIDTLTLTRIQPGHFSAMTRRVFSVLFGHVTWFTILGCYTPCRCQGCVQQSPCFHHQCGPDTWHQNSHTCVPSYLGAPAQCCFDSGWTLGHTRTLWIRAERRFTCCWYWSMRSDASSSPGHRNYSSESVWRRSAVKTVR